MRHPFATEPIKKKYCFLADLYQRGYEKQLPITEEALKEIQQIYSLQMSQKDFLSERTKALLEYVPEVKETFIADEKVQKKVLQIKEKSPLEKEDKVIAQGECLCIEGDYLSDQRIRVLKGGKLVFKGANVKVFKGNIVVEEGELHIESSSFRIEEKIDAPLFNIRGSYIGIHNSTFDGNEKAYLWVQTGGFLEVEKCIFKNTAQKSAIMLWDCPSRFKRTIFTKCKAKENVGGAVYTNSNASFEGCVFIECIAYKGAAIFRFASTIVWPALKGDETIKDKAKREPFLKLFGQKVNFVPLPKHLSSIPYPLILKENKFYKCKPIKEGVVCAYKEQVILQDNNLFEKCGLSKIAYYE